MDARTPDWLPKTLPVLAVRDVVHFPKTISTLHVARESSVEALRAAVEGDRYVLALSQRDMSVEDPKASDLYAIGTICKVQHAVPMPDGGWRATLRGMERARAVKFRRRRNVMWADAELLHSEVGGIADIAAAGMRTGVEVFSRIVDLHRHMPIESLQALAGIEDPGVFADTLVHHLDMAAGEKQTVLEEMDAASRLEKALVLAAREQSILEAQAQIRERVARDLDKSHREFVLREQLRAIQSELGEIDAAAVEANRFRERVEQASLPAEARRRVLQEIDRLAAASPGTQEAVIARSYLDFFLSLPWDIRSDEGFDLRASQALLDAQHFGLPQVKERVLDFLAVRRLAKDLRGPILCFVGPPGVGKTSMARSIARALGKSFVSVSLGGLRDEAEIRGHRKTYVGAMPGKLLQGLRTVGNKNPVMLLDEIDKMGGDFRGDPASALLEALDPTQNSAFTDHYLETTFDFSDVFFIATANTMETIPPALRDRLEIVEFSSYTDEERLEIARRHLAPKALREHGLDGVLTTIPDATLARIVTEFTRESGVRQLTRAIQAVCRKTARAFAEGEPDYAKHLGIEALDEVLGTPIANFRIGTRAPEIGIATSMVVGPGGGELVDVEAVVLADRRGQGEILATGNLGQLLVESAQAAVTFARSQGLTMAGDIHLHVAQAATPKDGPSAGLTLAVAIISAATGTPVRRDVALTGEITLRGAVLPVGGIREKLTAAARAGLSTVIIPARNEPDLRDVPASILQKLDVKLVSHASEALEFALAAQV